MRNDGIDGKRNLNPNCVGGDKTSDFPGSYNGEGLGEVPIGAFEANSPTTKWAAMELYVDWWQAEDPCGQKNYDFGIGEPTQMESNGYGFGIEYTLTTSKGTAPAGPIYAYGQAVHDDCPNGATTHCMDLNQYAEFPLGGEKDTPIYGAARHAFFPGRVVHNDVERFASGVWAKGSGFGDSTGDGAADLLYVRGAGGVANAYLGSSTSGLTWFGARQQPVPASGVKSFVRIPDVDKDSYSDYLYINDVGGLVMMLGGPQGTIFDNALSNAQFVSPYQIGSGWSGMRAVLPSANSLYAIRSDGALYYYRISATNSISDGGVRVTFLSSEAKGQGWGGIRAAVRVDWNRDGVWDILGVASDGRMIAYLASSDGTLTAKAVGSGWNDYQISVGGDLTGDGYSDVIARSGDGRVYVYPLTGNGFGSRRQIGSGFSGSAGDFLT